MYYALSCAFTLLLHAGMLLSGYIGTILAGLSCIKSLPLQSVLAVLFTMYRYVMLC